MFDSEYNEYARIADDIIRYGTKEELRVLFLSIIYKHGEEGMETVQRIDRLHNDRWVDVI